MEGTLVQKVGMARKKEDIPNRKYNKVLDILNERDRSMAWLSRKSGVSVTYVQRVCRQEAQPTLPKLFQLAEALELPPCDLLGDGSMLEEE